MADTIRCSLSLWTTPQSIFPVQRHSSIPVLPAEKKILCPCTSVLDLIFLDFWINEKPLHDTTNDRRDFSCSDSQCYVTALGFKTMLPYTSRKGQHKFGGGQPCPLADISFFHLCSYLIFKITSCVSQISPLHTHRLLGYMVSIPRMSVQRGSMHISTPSMRRRDGEVSHSIR